MRHVLDSYRKQADVVQHLCKETGCISTPRKAEKVDVIARSVVSHQKLQIH